VRDEYRRFVESLAEGGTPSLAAVYHGVRNIPYGAAGQRDPVQVLRDRVGSCSGKHILLRDLLRGLGWRADALTIYTHFNKAVPDHEALPAELRRMIREEEVPDFHHYVSVQEGDALALDATWHDRLIPFGFPVNRDWVGTGDTHLASAPIRTYPPAEDLAAFKEGLLGELTPEQRELRRRFFGLLTDWIRELDAHGRG
jgi:hypothetical protein